MKRFTIIIIALLLSFSLIGETVDRIVAKVGKEVILESELEKRYDQLLAMKIIDEEARKEDVLNDLIESELIIQAARDNEIETDKIQVKQLAEQQIAELKTQFSSELEFRRQLLMETGMDPAELKDYYITMITEQQLKEQIINEKIKSKLHVTEAEIEEYYNNNLSEIPLKPASDKLGMILLTIEAGEKTKDLALKEIMIIKDELNKGGSFEQIAGEKSDCLSSKNGGDLGFVERGTMVKEFEEAAFDLNPGEISDIVETQFGYHLIYMEERKEDRIWIRHILKKVEPSEEDILAISKLSKELKRRLEEGEDFADLAEEYSRDDSSAANGGVIGEFPEDGYPELFNEYLVDLDYGKYSDVIREGDNFYIFTKLEAIPERPYSYEELYDNLKDKALLDKQTELYDQWMNKLKNKSFIEIYL